MTKAGFLTTAAILPITIGGQHVQGKPMNFKTGSSGWNANGKVNIQLPNGEIVKAQVALNLIVVGSKEWADNDAPARAVAAPVAAPPAAPTPVTSANSPI